MIVGVNHAQVNVSPHSLDAAREFYIGFLGLHEIERPKTFTSPGIWMNAGTFEFHIGTEEGVDREKTRAHLAFEVSDVNHWRQKVESRGWEITDQPKIPNYDRFHFRDPFGNNIELIQRTKN
jgi:catechol 2,3-dioxygenase-like lactoylglutathione lyase family enzyme